MFDAEGLSSLGKPLDEQTANGGLNIKLLSLHFCFEKASQSISAGTRASSLREKPFQLDIEPGTEEWICFDDAVPSANDQGQQVAPWGKKGRMKFDARTPYGVLLKKDQPSRLAPRMMMLLKIAKNRSRMHANSIQSRVACRRFKNSGELARFSRELSGRKA
jgi:hypothetical protein